jgi:hypothetical protein
MAESTTTQNTAPVLLDLGRQKKKAIKRLRKGQGKLMETVNDTLHELQTAGKIGQGAQPIIVLVRERRRGMSYLRY